MSIIVTIIIIKFIYFSCCNTDVGSDVINMIIIFEGKTYLFKIVDSFHIDYLRSEI